LTADELAYVRSWVGTTVEEATLNERLARLEPDYDERGDQLYAVIHEELRAQLADARRAPSSVRTAAGTSISNVDPSVLERQLAKVESESGMGSSAVTTTVLTRDGARR
jgi:hypothetical protein